MIHWIIGIVVHHVCSEFSRGFGPTCGIFAERDKQVTVGKGFWRWIMHCDWCSGGQVEEEEEEEEGKNAFGEGHD